MTAAQHRLFEVLVQSASESRAQMHNAAWMLLGALLLVGIVALCAILLWVVHGGLVDQYALHSALSRIAPKNHCETAESGW